MYGLFINQVTRIQLRDRPSETVDMVAKQAIPAVMHIEVTEKQEVANSFLPFENDPFFRRFFGVPNMPKKFKQEVQGLGSRMIIDAQGHILTNNRRGGNEIASRGCPVTFSTGTAEKKGDEMKSEAVDPWRPCSGNGNPTNGSRLPFCSHLIRIVLRWYMR